VQRWAGGGQAASGGAGPEMEEEQVAVDLDPLHPGSSLASLASVALSHGPLPLPPFLFIGT
jgi:hypothetical protein